MKFFSGVLLMSTLAALGGRPSRVDHKASKKIGGSIKKAREENQKISDVVPDPGEAAEKGFVSDKLADMAKNVIGEENYTKYKDKGTNVQVSAMLFQQISNNMKKSNDVWATLQEERDAMEDVIGEFYDDIDSELKKNISKSFRELQEEIIWNKKTSSEIAHDIADSQTELDSDVDGGSLAEGSRGRFFRRVRSHLKKAVAAAKAWVSDEQNVAKVTKTMKPLTDELKKALIKKGREAAVEKWPIMEDIFEAADEMQAMKRDTKKEIEQADAALAAETSEESADPEPDSTPDKPKDEHFPPCSWWKMGNGESSWERQMRQPATSREACYQMVRNNVPYANGVTFWPGKGLCWAEVGTTGTVDYRQSQYWTCMFNPNS